MPVAQVEIWIDGHRWDDPANPATANRDGWYEWVLALDQVIRIVALYIDGQEAAIQPDNLLDIGENRFDNKETGRLLTTWGRAKTPWTRHKLEPRQFTRWQAIRD